MAETLHRAIVDALRDSKVYGSRGILVSLALTATTDLRAAPEQLLHRSIYTLFAALPWRLIPGSTLFISTCDIDGGIELVWEGREEPSDPGADLAQALRGGPHGDLVDIALTALRTFCALREGRVEVELTPLPSSPRFARGVALRRRVTAVLPARPHEAPALAAGEGAAEG